MHTVLNHAVKTFADSFSTTDTSLFSLLAAVSALAKFGAQNENLLPSILVLLQRWVGMSAVYVLRAGDTGQSVSMKKQVRPNQNSKCGDSAEQRVSLYVCKEPRSAEGVSARCD